MYISFLWLIMKYLFKKFKLYYTEFNLLLFKNMIDRKDFLIGFLVVCVILSQISLFVVMNNQINRLTTDICAITSYDPNTQEEVEQPQLKESKK